MAQSPNEILTRAGDILLDASFVRWTQAELLRYLNDGRRDLAIHRPDLYSVTEIVTLAGGSKQSIPSDGFRFLNAVRNVSASNVVGRALRIIEREMLDAQNPSWHTVSGSTSLKHFMFDERVPKTFYVYPPAVAGHKLEIAYSKAPVDITDGQLASTSALENEEIYAGALLDYVLYRAFSKDAEYAANLQRASMHYNAFATALGIGNRKRIAGSPNVSNAAGTPPKNATLEVT